MSEMTGERRGAIEAWCLCFDPGKDENVFQDVFLIWTVATGRRENDVLRPVTSESQLYRS